MLEALIGQRVVLDTQGALLYIGTLRAVEPTGYLLENADLYDRNEGHSTKEVYLNDAYLLERSGQRRVNRRRVYVAAATVASGSALQDVVSDELIDDEPSSLR
jgi:small nuclear ribonucleoprotein (snRNP)-like protein